VGYVLKDRVVQVEDFLDALEGVAAGATALDPEVVRQLMTHAGRRDPLGGLTEREGEGVARLTEGSDVSRGDTGP
jgi:DNA-binding NarL/FixJ family response regulator